MNTIPIRERAKFKYRITKQNVSRKNTMLTVTAKQKCLRKEKWISVGMHPISILTCVFVFWKQ